MKHWMLDMETLGNQLHPIPVVQIGLIDFNVKTGEANSVHDWKLDLTSQLNFFGAVPSDSTIRWWMTQEQEAREAVFYHGERVSIEKAMEEIGNLITGDDRIWSHAQFDAAILMDWMARTDTNHRISYRNLSDLRTIRYLFDPLGKVAGDTPSVTPKHEAISDCKWQAMWLAECIRRYIGKNHQS